MKQQMDISPRGVDFIKGWEYFVGYIYDDFSPPRSVGGKLVYPEWDGGSVKGTLTEGYGHTKAAAGRGKWAVGSKLTEPEAEQILYDDLRPVVAFVNKVVKVALTQGQFDALCSFTFNCGEGTLQNSTLLRRLNSGDYAGARTAFDLYTRSKGKVMRGLQRRRDAEQVLWDEDGDVVIPQEPVYHTAEVDTPPVKSMAKSTEGMTALAQTVGGTGGAAQQGFDAYDAADKIIEAKGKAEALGVEPIKLFDKLSMTLSILIQQPAFWFCLAIVIAGVYLWLRRRWRLQGEI